MRGVADYPWHSHAALVCRGVRRGLGRGYAINYGIKTGFNDAFIIDNQTKDALITEDPRSAEIIKPVLRGRDIQRYQAHWKGMWLIATFPALALNIDDYPAVRKYLLTFGRERLEQSGKLLPNGYVSRGRPLPDGAHARKKTGHAWYEMQDTCAYHAEFTREKLFWIDLTDQGRFAYDDSELFCVNSAYMLTGNALKYLCAVLNSALITWFMQNSALNSGMGTARWVRFTVDRIPIPMLDVAAQQPFIRAVDEIHNASRMGTRTTALESDLDSLVYELYGLTEEEIGATTGIETTEP